MLAINRPLTVSAALAAIVLGFTAESVGAPPDAVDNELTRFNGHWRVIEMVEDGRAIPEDQMRQWLPGGGVLEIVDYTILFKSPIDGTKSTKSYRLDPSSYPKRIAIMERDNTTGTGIYKFDQGKLIVCVTNEASQIPTEFSAHTGSKRTMIVMERFDPGASDIPGLNARLPERKPLHIPTPPPTPPVAEVQRPAVPPPVPRPVPQPAPKPVPASVAARVLTDTEVRNMTIGTWRINDTEGSIDIAFGANGAFQTYRYFRTLNNFQEVFAPTPISSGNWSIVNGRLVANVSSSTRLDRINQSFVPAVRSISATDMILVDHLGRVSRAVKLR
jgi:uncharacterized protein (TIGR03067 family)